MGMSRDMLSTLSGFPGSGMPRLQLRSRSTTRKGLTAVLFLKMLAACSQLNAAEVLETHIPASSHACQGKGHPAQAARRLSCSSSYSCELSRCWRRNCRQMLAKRRKVSTIFQLKARDRCT